MWTRNKVSTVDNPGTECWIISFNGHQVGRVAYAPERPGIEPWIWSTSERPEVKGRAWTEEAALNSIRESQTVSPPAAA